MVLHVLQLLPGPSRDATVPVAWGCCHNYHIHCADTDPVANFPNTDSDDVAAGLALSLTSIKPYSITIAVAWPPGHYTCHHSHGLRSIA